MRRKLLFTLMALMALAGALSAQPWRAGSARANDVHAARDAFEAWKAAHPEYKSLKGWKWMERWLWLQEARVPADGNPETAARSAYANLLHYLGGQKVMSDGGNWDDLGVYNQVNIGWTGRINCIVMDPLDTMHILIGTPDGGVWSTSDGGQLWAPMTDQLPTLGVSTIAFDPTNTSTIYIGTGDRENGYVGVVSDSRSVGLLKTTDGGTTWLPTGLNWTVQNPVKINKILIDATDHNTLVVATSANIQRSTDAGATWTPLASGEFMDVVQDPVNSLNFTAATRDQVYRSTDGGLTFNLGGAGLPSGSGRIAIASNGTYVYALLCDQNGQNVGIFRSTDNGANFTPRNTTTTIVDWQGTYNLVLHSEPITPEIVYAGTVALRRSTDGGLTWPSTMNGNFVDHHAIARIGSAIVVGADQGVFFTYDEGASWSARYQGLQIMQHYRLDIANHANHRLTTGVQDMGGYYYANGLWNVAAGGDGTGAAVDKSDPNRLYATSYESVSASTDGGTTWPYTNITSAISAEMNHWVLPMAASPTVSGKLYVGQVNLYSTTDLGVTWANESNFPDLFFPRRIIAIGTCETDDNHLWICTPDSIHRTTDGGTTWLNVTPSGLNTGYMLSDVWVHATNPAHAWVATGGYTDGNKVWATTDGGSTWTNISAGLPNIPSNCGIHAPGLGDDIFLGMDDGVYHYNATAAVWTSYSQYLPKAIVTDLAINPALGMIYASTYGRGIWFSPLGLVGRPDAATGLPRIVVVPNPADQAFALELDLQGQPQGTVELLDAQGRVLRTQVVTEAHARVQVQRDGLPAGVYFAVLRTERGRHVAHVVLR